MIVGAIAGLLGRTKLAEDFIKPAAWGITIVGAIMIAIPLISWAKSSYDASVIEADNNRANVEFLDDLNTATGKADLESKKRGDDMLNEIFTTEELIDEANDKKCAVADYLFSNGTKCVPTQGAEQVPGS